MRLFVKRFSALCALLLLLESVNGASNLKWVQAGDCDRPKFAVTGGENFSGEVLWVARILLKKYSTLAPGKMASSYNVAHTSYGGKEIYKSDYEILTNPGWKSHLEWKKSSGYTVPSNAVVGGYEKDGTPLYVARFMYVDGHMIPGKVNYRYGKAYVGYNNKEYENKEWYVLVEHPAWYVKRGIFKRSDFSELLGVRNHLKRTPVLQEK